MTARVGSLDTEDGTVTLTQEDGVLYLYIRNGINGAGVVLTTELRQALIAWLAEGA